MTESFEKLALVTRSPLAKPQTFVRRHIQYLNNGQTAVVCNKKYPEDVLDKPTMVYPRSSAEEYFRSWTGGASFLSRKKLLKRFFDEQNVSHVLVEFGYAATDLGHEITELGIPVYCMFRGNDGSSRLKSATYRRLLKQVFSKLDGIISVSSHLLDNLADHGFVHSNSIVVPSGADTKLFVPGTPENGLCVSVGRMVSKKSPEVMIRAFSRCCRKHDLRLELIGDGDLRRPMEELVRTLGIADRVKFHGHLPHDEVRQRVQSAMLYLQHFHTPPNGDSEGMPNVIQEAMSCGLPIVTTRHAGIPDHIEDRKNGMLVAPHDEDGFTQAIDGLMQSSSRREHIGEQARIYAMEHLDYRVSHQRIEKFMGLASANFEASVSS